MANNDNSVERTVIEASVLLITVLFIIAQLGRSDGLVTYQLAPVAALFVASIIFATPVMVMEESAWRKRLRIIELVFFLVGLMFLFSLFYFWSTQLEQSRFTVPIVVAVALAVGILSTIVSDYIARRRRPNRTAGSPKAVTSTS